MKIRENTFKALEELNKRSAEIAIYGSQNDDKNIKTFDSNSFTTVDRTDVCLDGIRYRTTESNWYEIIEDDMPKMKEILGVHLYDWALDGGKKILFTQDCIFDRSEL